MPPRSKISLIAFGLGLAYLAAYQQFKLPPVLPVLLDTYHYDRTLAGGLMSIYAVAGLFLSLGLGHVLSRRGLGGPILAGLGLMALGSVLCLLVPANAWIVLAGRALEGTGFAVLAIAGPVLANANASARQLPIVVGLTASWIPVGQLGATVLAPLAFAWDWWQMLWAVAIAASLAMALWTLGLQRQGALAVSAPGPSEAASTVFLTPLQRRSLKIAAGVFMLWSAQYFAYMTWMPQYLVEMHGLTPSMAAFGYVIPVIVLIVTTIAVGLVLRTGVPVGLTLVVGLTLQLVVWILVPVVGAGPLGVASLIVYGIGAGICPTCLFAMPSVIVGPGAAAARAFGVIMTGRNLGVLLGPVVLAQAFKVFGGWDIAAPIFGSVTAGAAGLGIWLAISLGGRGYGAKSYGARR
jgi:MFS family permease